VALIEANPGVSAPALREMTGMSKSSMSSAVQSLCVSGRAKMQRGNGRPNSPNRYYPMQVAAE
jgi:DNA-binding transcriptional regulator GbsR (MarR family)